MGFSARSNTNKGQSKKGRDDDSEHSQTWKFSIFSEMGSGCLGIRGGRGVSRTGEVNPSAAGSGTDFVGVVGSIRCISISNSMHFLELMVEKINVS